MNARLLIVDDNEPVRQGLAAILRATPGWEVCGDAPDGLTALDMFANLHPQVVILDFQMPGLNGLEVARRMLEMAPAVPIIMLTQHASPALAEHALKIGIHSVVSKMDVFSITGIIEELLARDGSPRDAADSDSDGHRPHK